MLTLSDSSAIGAVFLIMSDRQKRISADDAAAEGGFLRCRRFYVIIKSFFPEQLMPDDPAQFFVLWQNRFQKPIAV